VRVRHRLLGRERLGRNQEQRGLCATLHGIKKREKVGREVDMLTLLGFRLGFFLSELGAKYGHFDDVMHTSAHFPKDLGDVSAVNVRDEVHPDVIMT
jgi:hypothetical protein